MSKLIKCSSISCLLRFQSSSPLTPYKRNNYNRTNKPWQLVSLWQLLTGERILLGEAFSLRTHTYIQQKSQNQLTQWALSKRKHRPLWEPAQTESSDISTMHAHMGFAPVFARHPNYTPSKTMFALEKKNLCSVISNYNNEMRFAADGRRRRHHHHRRCPAALARKLSRLLCFCLSRLVSFAFFAAFIFLAGCWCRERAFCSFLPGALFIIRRAPPALRFTDATKRARWKKTSSLACLFSRASQPPLLEFHRDQSRGAERMGRRRKS